MPFKVGKIPANQALNELFEQVKDDPRVIAINVPGCIDSAMASREKLINIKAEIKNWGIQEYDWKRKAAERTMKEFDANSSTIQDYFETLTVVASKRKLQTNVTKRRRRHKISNIKKHLLKRRVPRGTLAGWWTISRVLLGKRRFRAQGQRFIRT